MSFKKHTKNLLSFLFRIGLSLALLLYVFSKIDLQKTGEILKSADLLYIVLAAIIFLSINGILLFRWLIFIKALDLSTTLGSVTKHFFYGLFGNLFLPTAIGGDIIKAVGLCKDSSQKPKVVASVLLDRLSGFASIIIIEVCVLFLGYSFVIEDKTISGAIITMGVGSLGFTMVLFNEKIYSFVCTAFNRLPKIKLALMNMHYDIALLRHKHKAIEGYKAIAVACLSQMAFVCCWVVIAKALHQDANFMHFVVFVPLLSVASCFPSIGGLGVREAAAVYLFSKVGMDPGIAVSISLITFLYMVMVGLIGGVIYVYSLSVGRVQYDAPVAGVEPNKA